MNNITINSNSNDIKEMEKLFPRAPLKICYGRLQRTGTESE